MGFQDRYYYREQSDRYNPLQWLFSGSLHLFSLSGIRVRAHVSLLLFVGLVMLTVSSEGYTLEHRAVSMLMLLALLILHELAHCFAARGVGGFADEVVLWPLGGLTESHYPHRPGPTFTAISAGPVLNLAVATLAAGLLHGLYHVTAPVWPIGHLLAPGNAGEPQFYLWYLYIVSYLLLLLNLLPIFPLDGGHLLQTLLWPALGYGRSLLFSCDVGIGASLAAGAYGVYTGEWLIIFAMIGCLAFCIQKRAAVRAAGVWTFDDYDSERRRPRRHHLSRFTKWRARRQIRKEEAELTRVDLILEKIQREGLHSLRWGERRILRHATDRQRQREMDVR